MLNYFFNTFQANLEEAEDLVQETFIRVFRFGESYDPAFAFSTWLWTIAKNVGVDWRRGGAFEASFIDPDESCRLGLHEKERQSRAPRTGSYEDIHEELEDERGRQRERATIHQAVGALTALQREVFLLKFTDGCSYKEISARTGATVSSIKGLIHRGKQKLREIT